MHLSRRHFIIVAAASVASAGTLPSLSYAAAAPVLAEDDPTARSLGYKTDAGQVDRGRFPRYLSGETCANCQLYQGKPGAGMGPCPIYGGKLVDAKGWCNAYVKKS
ncbi:high-potential iron-sulfur protein [Paraburkholderia terrae]